MQNFKEKSLSNISVIGSSYVNVRWSMEWTSPCRNDYLTWTWIIKNRPTCGYIFVGWCDCSRGAFRLQYGASGARRSVRYRVTHQVEPYILLRSIWGVPPACGPLLQLATAQAGQGNSLKLFRKTSLHDGMGNAVRHCRTLAQLRSRHDPGLLIKIYIHKASQKTLFCSRLWEILPSFPFLDIPFGLLDLVDDPLHKVGDFRVHARILLSRAAFSEAHDPWEGEPPVNINQNSQQASRKIEVL